MFFHLHALGLVFQLSMGNVQHVDAVYPSVAIARHTDDHEFERLAAGIFERMHLIELDRNRVAGLDWRRFGRYASPQP